jgi:hypothetical protein
MKKAPLDVNKEFVKSFTLDETEEYLKFFDEFGFVCIRDVLSEEESKNTVQDIYDYLESGSWNRLFASQKKENFKTNIKASDKSTWNQWPSMENEGILGTPAVFTKQAFKNRQNENVYKAFSTILNEKELLVSVDRYGFFRPTKNVEMDGEKCDFPKWKSRKNIHLDMNPWDYFSNNKSESQVFSNYNPLQLFCMENNEGGKSEDKVIRIQGLINLLDNHEEDGGFVLIPGFHKKLGEWTESNPRRGYGIFNIIPSSNEIQKYTQRITAKAGTLIIWDNRLEIISLI